jgi:DUF1009 family protein
MEKIGLIAGNRRFPILFAQAAKKKGYRIVAVAIKGDTSRALSNYADKIYWIGLNEFGRLFEIFKKEGIAKITMAGQISPHRLFSREVHSSKELQAILSSIKDKKADTIFGAVAAELKKHGLELMDSTAFLEELLPKKGTLSERGPDFGEWEDIYFGLSLAKEVAYLDIGQAVAVKGKAIVAVEALEGTDNLIRRAGKITRGGFILVKVSKPKQDLRFDIPVVGLNTVKNLIKARARCMAVEAGKTLFIDKEQSIGLADSKGISLVAV